MNLTQTPTNRHGPKLRSFVAARMLPLLFISGAMIVGFYYRTMPRARADLRQGQDTQQYATGYPENMDIARIFFANRP